MSWFKEHITPEIIMKAGYYIILAVIVAVLFYARVGDIEATQKRHLKDYEQFRYQTVPDTYMRKDVAEQVIIRLERIENKIDNMNQ